jgi:glycine cleavage system aminomethyltransferase T
MSEATLHRTALYDEHVKAGAKLVPFAGYEMPVQYPNRHSHRTQLDQNPRRPL